MKTKRILKTLIFTLAALVVLSFAFKFESKNYMARNEARIQEKANAFMACFLKGHVPECAPDYLIKPLKTNDKYLIGLSNLSDRVHTQLGENQRDSLVEKHTYYRWAFDMLGPKRVVIMNMAHPFQNDPDALIQMVMVERPWSSLKIQGFGVGSKKLTRPR